MLSSDFAEPGARFALLVAATILFSSAIPASGQTLFNGANPWHRIAVFDTDEDHAHHVLEPSPFDGLSEFQLAAVPKANRIHYNAPEKCVPGQLKTVLKRVAEKYGPITVNSTFRSSKRNRKVGGKKRSWHLKCAAVDFRVHAGTKGLLSYLQKQKEVGGYKRYKSGFYHIDIGPRRTW